MDILSFHHKNRIELDPLAFAAEGKNPVCIIADRVFDCNVF